MEKLRGYFERKKLASIYDKVSELVGLFLKASDVN